MAETYAMAIGGLAVIIALAIIGVTALVLAVKARRNG